jgi:hypothetical protein
MPGKEGRGGVSQIPPLESGGCGIIALPELEECRQDVGVPSILHLKVVVLGCFSRAWRVDQR